MKTPSITLLIFGILISITASSAPLQETDSLKTLPAIIKADMELSGSWLVSQNTLISEGANLSLAPGSKLFMAAGVQLGVMGGLHVAGTAEDRVYIGSVNPENAGGGIVVSDLSTETILIEYAVFEGLHKPLLFGNRWSRSLVGINHCTFLNNPADGTVIEIRAQDEVMGFKNSTITIRNNAFFNNSGSVFIADLNSARHQTIIKSNVFNRNQYNGISSQGFFNTPMLINYQAHGNNPETQIEGNVIYDNFSSTYENGIAKSRRVNICITGSAANIDLKNNYFGRTENKELETTHQLLSEQFKVPFVVNSNPLSSLPGDVANHLMHFNYNNQAFDGDEQAIKQIGSIEKMTLLFNEAMDVENELNLYAYLVQNDTVFRSSLQKLADWSEKNTVLNVLIPEVLSNDSGEVFMELSGLISANGQPMAAVYPGKKTFFSYHSWPYSVLNDFEGRPIVDVEESVFRSKITTLQLEKLIKNEEEVPSPDKLSKPNSAWQVSIYSGIPMYFGDLASTVGELSLYNLKSAWGPAVTYWARPQLSFELRNSIFSISGSDNPTLDEGKNRGTGFSRNLAFRSRVVELALTTRLNLKPSGQRTGWNPGIHGGITAFYFNPQWTYNGDWYNLRDIGTEGQTINGDNRYSRVSVGIPMGLHLTREFNKHWSMSVSYTYTKLFTDYLDDVSTGNYPDEIAIREANPSNPDAAAYLSNPGKLRGQRSSGEGMDAYAIFSLSLHWRLPQKLAF